MKRGLRDTVAAAVLVAGAATAFAQGGPGGGAGMRGGAGGVEGGAGMRGGAGGSEGGARGADPGGAVPRGGDGPGRAPLAGAAERSGPTEKGGPAERGGREAGPRGDRDETGPGPRGGRDARDAGERDGRDGARGDGGGRGARGAGPARGAVGRLDTRQRSAFRGSITRLGVSRLTDVAFGLAVGTAIPRSVSLHRLPPAIVEIVPEYEGYDFILVRDDIVIVDPDTYEIVDVIPA